jgi:hypothetical protein
VIFTVIEGHKIYKILVDDESSVNILYTEAITKMDMNTSRMTIMSTPFMGIKGSIVLVKGAVE